MFDKIIRFNNMCGCHDGNYRLDNYCDRIEMNSSNLFKIFFSNSVLF